MSKRKEGEGGGRQGKEKGQKEENKGGIAHASGKKQKTRPKKQAGFVKGSLIFWKDVGRIGPPKKARCAGGNRVKLLSGGKTKKKKKKGRKQAAHGERKRKGLGTGSKKRRIDTTNGNQGENTTGNDNKKNKKIGKTEKKNGNQGRVRSSWADFTYLLPPPRPVSVFFAATKMTFGPPLRALAVGSETGGPRS